jgi:hypothetical protein
LWADFLLNRQRQSEKWPHYFPIYETHFSRFVDRPVVLLEIGVDFGGSLQMWKRFLGPHAQIVGLDIQPKAAFDEDQIAVRIGDQSDPEVLQALLDEFGPPDIVVDDGSHVMAHVHGTFAYLYPRMSGDGVYLVEDMQTAYLPHFGGALHSPASFIETAKTLIDELNAEHTLGAVTPTEFTHSTMSIHFYDGVIVFERGRHALRPPVRTGSAVDIARFRAVGRIRGLTARRNG